MKAPADDVTRRRPVWLAMSELFLDTELGPADFRLAGAALAASEYGDDELSAIFWDEVYPACIANLLAVVGASDGFRAEWLERLILDDQRTPGRHTRHLLLRPHRWIVRNDWNAVLAVVHDLRDHTGVD